MGKTQLSERQMKQLGVGPSKVFPFLVGFVVGFLCGIIVVALTPSVPAGQRTPTTTAAK
jgi:hypothetical protein